MFRFATQSLQSFPLDTFPLPRRPNSAGFGRRSRRSRRGKSGSAGFGRRSRRAGGESQAVQVLAVVHGGAGGESQAVQVSAVVHGEQAGKVRQYRFWPKSPEGQAGKVRQCRFRPSFPESRRGKSGSAGFGRRSQRAGEESPAVQVSAVVPEEQAGKVSRPAGRFRRPTESILLTAEDDKSRRNRGKYDNDVLNFFSKSANLVVFEFVGLPDDLELPWLRTNSRSL